MQKSVFNPAEQIFIALDGMSRSKAMDLVAALHPRVRGFKVNSLWHHAGPRIVDDIKSRSLSDWTQVWADLKLNDTPDTMRNSVIEIAQSGAEYVTIHANSGINSVKAAVEAADDMIEVIAVTVLTSISADQCLEIYRDSPRVMVGVLSDLAFHGGVSSLVCSGEELVNRPELKESFKLYIPGVRSPGADRGSQKRVVTPSEAINAGAHAIVVGSEVTKDDDPAGRLEKIISDIQQGLAA